METVNSPDSVKVEFLILKKGTGTKELSTLAEGDEIDVLGPVGNTFSLPKTSKIAIVGAGIGIAPVAGFAASLPAKSYDFYAGFKTGSYGLDYVHTICEKANVQCWLSLE